MNHVKILSHQADALLQAMGQIDAEHWLVTIGPNCWGRGETISESFKNCKASAPRGRGVYFVTRVCPREGFSIDPVDGSVWWNNEAHNASQCPTCSVGKGMRVTVS